MSIRDSRLQGCKLLSDIGPTKNEIVRMLEKCDSGRTSRLLIICYLYLSNLETNKTSAANKTIDAS